MECRKHEPDEDNTNKNKYERNAITISCDHCEEEFTPDEAQMIAIFGSGEIRYTCPRCGHGTDGPPPILNEK
jgi:Zn finger protein HypA/HybF involved in hydrogenase expression